MLYHVSPTSGIKVLQPRTSSHHRAYVYAIHDLTTALLFGARKDDFDFLQDTDETQKPVLYECYPGAFQKVYQNKCCSVYEVEEAGFVRGITGWKPEWVCETAVAVKREIPIADLYTRLLEEEAGGRLTINRYAQDPAYRRLIASHLVDRLIRFELLEHFDTTDVRGELYFRPLIDGLKSLMDGHLLPATAWPSDCAHNINTKESSHGNQL